MTERSERSRSLVACTRAAVMHDLISGDLALSPEWGRRTVASCHETEATQERASSLIISVAPDFHWFIDTPPLSPRGYPKEGTSIPGSCDYEGRSIGTQSVHSLGAYVVKATCYVPIGTS